LSQYRELSHKLNRNWNERLRDWWNERFKKDPTTEEEQPPEMQVG
jgi:hypothetical protein